MTAATAPEPAAPGSEPAAPGPETAGPGPETPARGAFADLGLPADLLTAVEALGFTTPTRIQAAAIPPLLAGRDITGVAQTGTGKTAAFSLPLLAAVDAGARHVQALVLTPTRELAIQVAEAISDLAAHSRGLDVVPIYGGASFAPQLRGLARGAQVVVGTPGRVIDLLSRGSLDLSSVRYLVLDEADEMLRMGFAEDVEQILTHTPAGRQVALFSATMPPPIRAVAQAHLTDPVEVATSRQSSTVSTVEQTYAVVPFRHKVGALARVLATAASGATLVFVRTRGTAEEVGAALVERGIPAAAISGDVPQRERERIVERLRSGSLDVLVATDVAARGLDVERIGLVVNFDVPAEPEVYVHRIGRTGRAGREGRALTFLTPHERSRLRAIERLTRTALTEVAIPTPADVAAHRASAALAAVPGRLETDRLGLYREAVERFLGDHGVDAAELAAALLAAAVGDAGPRPRDEEEATVPAGRGPGAATPGSFESARFDGEHPVGARGERPPRAKDRPGTRRVAGTVYRVAVGHEHGARPEAIVGAITGEGGLRGSDLGKIDIYRSFSLVEIGADLGPEAARRIGAARVAGRPLRIRLDGGPRSAGHTSRPERPRPPR
jgi:ATP-dependent RNA helicase DeaD